MSSRSIHLRACVRISFRLRVNNIPLIGYATIRYPFIHPSPLDCFQLEFLFSMVLHTQSRTTWYRDISRRFPCANVTEACAQPQMVEEAHTEAMQSATAAWAAHHRPDHRYTEHGCALWSGTAGSQSDSVVNFMRIYYAVSHRAALSCIPCVSNIHGLQPLYVLTNTFFNYSRHYGTKCTSLCFWVSFSWALMILSITCLLAIYIFSLEKHSLKSFHHSLIRLSCC